MRDGFQQIRRSNLWYGSLLFVSIACQSTPSTQHATITTPAEQMANDVDRTRAVMPLHKIKPAIKNPSRASIKPLSDQAAQRITKARSLVTQQRFTEAALELERALRHDPNHPDIHSTLAVLHWQAGNNERAKTHARRALESHDDIAAAHYIQGRELTLASNDRDAIAAYRTALKCSDFNSNDNIAAQCHYHLARALEHEGYFQASLDQYKAFEKTATGIKSEFRTQELVTLIRTSRRSVGEAKSRMFEKLGQFAQAAQALETVIRTSPPNTARTIRLAKLLLHANQLDKALAAAKTIDSDDEEIIKLLFDIYERAGHPERMLNDLRERISHHPDEPRFVLNLADLLIRLNRLDEVQKELEQFLVKSPSAHQIRERLIDVHIKRESWTEVLTLCSEGYRNEADRTVNLEEKLAAIAQNPEVTRKILEHVDPQDDHILIYVQGLLAWSAGKVEIARSRFKQSHEKDSTFVPARIALGNLYYKNRRYQEAIEIAARQDEALPENVELELILGKVYERLDELEKAQLHLRAANQLDRTNVETIYALAKIYRSTRKNNQAQRQIRLLLELDPKHDAARELLAQIYSEQGKRNEAMEHIQKLMKLTDKLTTKVRCKIILNADAQSDPKTIRSQLLRALETGIPDAETLIAIALTYGPDELQQQKEYLLRALAITPDHIDTLQILENTQRKLLDFEQAAQTHRRLMEIYPNRYEWKIRLIDMLWDIHEFDSAVSLIQDTLASDHLKEDQIRNLRIALLETYRLAKQDDKLIHQLQTWIGELGETSPWPLHLADEYVRKEKYELAIPIYKRVYKENPTQWKIFRVLVRTLQKAGQFELASQYALDRLSLDPDNDTAVWTMVELLSDADRIDDMKELVQNRLLHTLNRSAFQNILIDHLRVKNRHDEGTDYIESLIDEILSLIQDIDEGKAVHNITLQENRAIHRLPNKPFTLDKLHERLQQLRFRYVLANIASKDFQQAIDQINLWLKETRNPQVRLDYLQLLVAAQRGDHNEKEATLTMERALQLKPDDAPLRNDISYGWIDQGIRLVEAEKMIRYAIYRRPRQRAYLDTYGWLLYKKGEFTQARKWLERAWKSVGREDPVVYDHLGDTLWRLDKKDEAIEHWKRAAALTVDKTEEDLISDDERRVHATIEQKINAANTHGSPEVAPLMKLTNAEADNNNNDD